MNIYLLDQDVVIMVKMTRFEALLSISKKFNLFTACQIKIFHSLRSFLRLEAKKHVRNCWRICGDRKNFTPVTLWTVRTKFYCFISVTEIAEKHRKFAILREVHIRQSVWNAWTPSITEWPDQIANTFQNAKILLTIHIWVTTNTSEHIAF